ncbi:MAG: hypothetical protein ACRDPC_16145 [Solirubrobacteraceae bacterium]
MDSHVTPPPEGYALAFEEGVRGLARQESELDALRSRAGILLSAAAIATSFLGGRALDGDEPVGWTWVAIACFAGLAAGALVILWPRRAWSFSATPGTIVSLYLEQGRAWTVAAIQRELALHMDHAYVLNGSHLDRLIWIFRVTSALLALEVVAWVVNLATVT